MLGTFLDKASGLLDKGFIIAYWFPVFIAASIAVLIRARVYGWKASLELWQQNWTAKAQEGAQVSSNIDLSGQIIVLVGALILVTVLAYMLLPFTRSVVRFYEGYWPLGLQNWFTNLPLLGEKAIWQKMSKKCDKAELTENWQVYNHLYVQLFHSFPSKDDRLMPMRLGNTLRASEDYSKAAYGDGMDCVFWWPRMWPLMPEAVQKEIDESVTPMVALLNFSSLIVLVCVAGSVYLNYETLWREGLLLLLAGLALGWLSYRSAVAQGQDYGEKIRSAVDLYRFDLLKAIYQPLPKSLDEEILLWKKLMLWLYNRDRGAVAAMKYDLRCSSEEGRTEVED
jgi:hypothetical protein